MPISMTNNNYKITITFFITHILHKVRNASKNNKYKNIIILRLSDTHTYAYVGVSMLLPRIFFLFPGTQINYFLNVY